MCDLSCLVPSPINIEEFLSLKVICMRKCEELGFISRAVEMLHEEIELYAEVEYIANFCKGTCDAAESGTLTENPEQGPWHWHS